MIIMAGLEKTAIDAKRFLASSVLDINGDAKNSGLLATTIISS